VATKEVPSGFWSDEQKAMCESLSDPGKANLSPRSDPVQTKPRRPIPSTPLYGTRKRAAS
jgi:hypothetical protein